MCDKCEFFFPDRRKSQKMEPYEALDIVEGMAYNKTFDKEILSAILDDMKEDFIFSENEISTMEKMISAEDRDFFPFFWKAYNRYDNYVYEEELNEALDIVEDMRTSGSFDKNVLFHIVEDMWNESIFNSDELDTMERMISVGDKEFFTFFWNVYNQYADLL